jgi:hypothetical protein
MRHGNTKTALPHGSRLAAGAVLLAALAGLGGCKRGDGATGVNPPADTRRAVRAPSPDRPRQS